MKCYLKFQSSSLFHKFSNYHERWISLMYNLQNKSTAYNAKYCISKYCCHNYPLESVSSARNVCISYESGWFLSICDNEWHHTLHLREFRLLFQMHKLSRLNTLGKKLYQSHSWYMSIASKRFVISSYPEQITNNGTKDHNTKITAFKVAGKFNCVCV